MSIIDILLAKALGGSGGGGSSALVVNIDNSKETPEMDKTWQEIKDAGANVLFQSLEEWGGMPFNQFYPYTMLGQFGEDAYVVTIAFPSGHEYAPKNFVADSPTGVLRLEDIS